MAANLELVIRAIDKSSGVLGQIEGKAHSLSNTLRNAVSAGALAGGTALIGLGTAAVIAAAKFEETMSRIEGLTNAPAESIDHLRDQILKMAGEVAKSPEELGAGAYFILSSGITDTATAMRLLELSAKASAAGLGETKVIANALTSVMNAYQLSADDAAKATDTLVNIVKLGKGEPAELASAIGFVIPIAAQMGVEFEQVGAVLATLTNTGLDASESVTALKGIFNQVLSPTETARKKFAELGLPLEEFSKMVDEDFVAAMQKLMGAVGGSEETLALLFPEIRGLTGVMAAFGNQSAQTAANIAQLQNGAGALDKAFAAASDTTSFKFKQAMTNLQVILTKVGLQLLPSVNKALAAFSQWLSENEEEINRVIAALGEFARSEAFPFLESAFTQLIQLIEGIKNTGIIQWITEHKEVALALALAIGALAIAFGGPIVTIVALVAVLTILLAHWDQIRNKIEEVVHWLREHKTEVTALTLAIGIFLGPLGLVIGSLVLLVTHWHTVVDVINNVVIPAFNVLVQILSVTLIPWIQLHIDILWQLYNTSVAIGDALAAPFRTARDWVKVLVEWVHRLIDAIHSIPSLPGTDLSPGFNVPNQIPIIGRALGGAVAAGRPYWVGELGMPELFVPKTSGTIVPALAGGGQTVHLSLAVNFNSTISDASPSAMHRAGKLVAELVRQELQKG